MEYTFEKRTPDEEGIVNLKKSLDELSPLTSHFWVFSGPSSGENLG
jgi:hypothetical protein